MYERSIWLLKNNILQRKPKRCLRMFPPLQCITSSNHSSITEEFSVLRAKVKLQLDTSDLWTVKQHSINNCHSTRADITMWARNYFIKPLSRIPIQSYIHKCKIKMYWAKKKPHITLSRGGIDVSGLRLIWHEPSHSGTLFWSDQSVFQIFFVLFGRTDVLYSGLKTERLIKTFISNKPKSQPLWYHGAISVPLIKLMLASVKVRLIQKSSKLHLL